MLPQKDELLELAERTAAGDLGAFDALVRATLPRLYRMCARLLGDTEEAHDVIQEVYLRVHEALLKGQFRQQSTLQTWLHRVVVHRSFNALRANRNRRKLVESQPPRALAVDEGLRLEAREGLRRIETVFSDLPDEQRVALVLKELEGLSSREVAEVLGIAEGAVEQRLVRARATLRKKLAGGEHE